MLRSRSPSRLHFNSTFSTQIAPRAKAGRWVAMWGGASSDACHQGVTTCLGGLQLGCGAFLFFYSPCCTSALHTSPIERERRRRGSGGERAEEKRVTWAPGSAITTPYTWGSARLLATDELHSVLSVSVCVCVCARVCIHTAAGAIGEREGLVWTAAGISNEGDALKHL